MSSSCNPSRTFYPNRWDNVHEWLERNDQMTAPKRADADDFEGGTTSESEKFENKFDGKKNKRYVHVPHSEKPPLVVARRNARERRRVQAVNSAFTKLRKAIPLDNNRGKRVSKVKTLKYAIRYIQGLMDLLNEGVGYNLNFFRYDLEDFLGYEDSF